MFRYEKKAQMIKGLSVAIILLGFIVLFTGAAQAGSIAFTTQADNVTIGQDGAWTITVDNTDASSRTLTVDLTEPLSANFTITNTGGGTQVGNTLTWTIPANSGPVTRSFNIKPGCNAGTGKQITASMNSIPPPIPQNSNQITVGIPIINLTLLDGSNNSVVAAQLGNTVTWYFKVENSGNGALLTGADLNFTLGGHFGFTSIASPSGHTLPVGGLIPGAAASWNTGNIAAGSSANYTIVTTVNGCDRFQLVNNVTMNYKVDGLNCLTDNRSASSSIALDIREPVVNITLTDPTPTPILYCPAGSDMTITLNNTGTGPANNFTLQVPNWPSDWQISDILPAGASFNPATKTFTIPNVNGGATVPLNFNVAATTCTPTASATLFFIPDYTNECGATYGTEYITPIAGPKTLTIAPAGDPSSTPPVPTFTVNKTVDKATAMLGDTLNYTITVTYTGPAGTYTVDVQDTYDSALLFVSADAGYTQVGSTLTWASQSFTSSGQTRTYHITTQLKDYATDPCGAYKDYCNTASVLNPVPASFIDCRTCPDPVVLDSGNVCTYVPDVNGPAVQGSSVTPPAVTEVCTDLGFTTCYTFSNTAPAGLTDWTGISLNTNKAAGAFGNATVTEIRVNGTDQSSHCTLSFPMNLACLNTFAPNPNSGATVCVDYNYPSASVGNTAGNKTETVSLTTPTSGSGCPGTQTYDVYTSFSVDQSVMNVVPRGPTFMDKCGTETFYIDISGSKIAYDASVTLNTNGNYTFVRTNSFINIKNASGTDIAMFEPTPSGNTYTWNFGDFIPAGTIEVEMKRRCDATTFDWQVSGKYNNKCEDGTNPSARTAGPATQSPLMILQAKPTLHLVPQKIYAVTPYPEFTAYIVNGGNGAMYDVDLTIMMDKTSNNDLEYLDHSAAGANIPDSITPDIIRGNHQVVFRYNQINPGAEIVLPIRTLLRGCSSLYIDAKLTWCNGDLTCDAALEKQSVVELAFAEAITTEHTGTPIDYCLSGSGFHLAAVNSGKSDVYNVQLTELLPTGVSYTLSSTAATLNGSPIIPLVSTIPVGSRQKIIWDFSTVLPLDADGNRPLTVGSKLSVDFQVSVLGCMDAAAYNANEQAEAGATYQKPCQLNSGPVQTSSAPKLYKSQPGLPNVNILKEGRNLTKGTSWTSGVVNADNGDTIEWRTTYTSNGVFPALNTVIKETLPADVNAASSFSTTCVPCAQADYFGAGGCNIGTMSGTQATPTSCAVTYQTTVTNCHADPNNGTANAVYGCCSAAPMQRTSNGSINLRTQPTYASGDVGLANSGWTTCGGQKTITLTNNGGTAITDTVTDTLPPGYIFDDTPGFCTITASGTPPLMAHAAFNCAGISGNTPTWLPANIDKVYPGETITITYWAKLAPASANCDTIPANDPTDPADVPIPDYTGTVTYNYHNSCDVTQITTTASNTINPAQSDIDFVFNPAQQIVAPGETATWTLTLTNEGDAPARNLTLTDTLGSGFISPSFSSVPSGSSCGAFAGNIGICTIPGPIAPGGTWTVTIQAVVNSGTPGSLTHHATVEGDCQDRGGINTCTYTHDETDTYTAGFEQTKSRDKATANVGELITYTVRAEFTNTDTFQNVNVVDTLPPYMEYISATATANNNAIFGAPIPSAYVDDGTQQTISWSGLTFTGPRVLEYQITARIRDNAANHGAPSATVLTNTVQANFDVEFTNPDLTTTTRSYSDTKTVTTTVTEPNLAMTKDITPAAGDAGDTVTITLTVRNNGDGPAREVSVTDLVNDTNNDGVVDASDTTVYDCTNVAEGTTPAGWTYSLTGAAPACQVNYASSSGSGDIPAGENRVFTFTATISQQVVTGTVYTNTGKTNAHSLNHDDSGFNNPVYDADNRTQYSATDDDTVNINDATAPSKTIISTSESSTDNGDLNNNPPVAVGEVVELQIRFVLPEGVTNSVRLYDRLQKLPLSAAGAVWGRYVPGSAYLSKSSASLSSAVNPGGINGGAINTQIPIPDANIFETDNFGFGTENYWYIYLDLGAVSNSDMNNATEEAYILTLKVVVSNNAATNAGVLLTDQGRLRYDNAGGTSIYVGTPDKTLHVAEPTPTITKTANPLIGQGGDTITFSLQFCNTPTGTNAAPAFNWIFSDLLPAQYENPILVSGTNANISAAFTGNTLNGTITRLDPGACETLTYTAQLIVGVPFNISVTNTASFTTSSLPGDNGTGNATPGTPGSVTGERNGSGGVNDLTATDDATVMTSNSGLVKQIVNPKAYYAIGDVVTYKIGVAIPIGTSTNFIMTDILPDGLIYNGTNTVTFTPAGGFTPILPAFNWDSGTRTLTWNFGTVTATSAGTLEFTFDAKVDDVPANQDGIVLSNSATLRFGASSVVNSNVLDLTVGEPNLSMSKVFSPAGNPYPGKPIRWTVTIRNDNANSHTTAYRVNWKDALPNYLYQISNAHLVISGGNIYRNNTTTALLDGDLAISTTTNTNDTIALPLFQMDPGAVLTVIFDSVLSDKVPSGQVLVNAIRADYNSQPNTGTGGRDNTTNPGSVDDDNNADLNNYEESVSTTLTASTYQLDFGDVPESYGTSLTSPGFAQGGARHVTTDGSNTRLGTNVDNELTGQPIPTALGDDTNGTTPDDEDGIVFVTPIMPSKPGQPQQYEIQVNASAGSVLNAWIDFNGNGAFDSGERIFSDQALAPGTQSFILTAPVSAAPFPTTLYSRFRVTQNIGEGGDSPTGIAYSGEVEDYALMSLGDVVWNDNGLGGGTANNGIKDGTEPGIAGVTVQLLDSAGAVIATTTTDANGRYLFTGLNPGDYSVRIPSGNFDNAGDPLYSYISTTGGVDPDNNANENADENGIDDAAPAANGISSQQITLALGTEPVNDGDADANSNKTVDFGFYAPVNLGNLVWHDANGNGLRDAGETGIDNVPVRLFREGDNPLTATPVAATTTSGGGIYNFNNLIPGRYFVYLPTPPALYPASSTVTDTADDDKDNDDNGSQTASGQPVTSPVITLASGTETTGDGDGNNGNLTVDFGFYAPVSIGNLVWRDINNNGIVDSGEPGIDGVELRLFHEGDNPLTATPVAITTSSGGGLYKFSSLSPGRYFVYIPTPPPDYLASSSAIVTDTDDNGQDNDDNGIQSAAGAPTRSPIITLTSRGEPDTGVDGDDINGDMTVDFGFHTSVNIGNFVWLDGNVNGIQDAGEPGIPNVTVSLFDKDGNPVSDVYGNPVNPTKTDADGYYEFADLPPGQYYVQFDKPAGYYPSPVHQGSDTSKDSDADTTTGKTPIITLTATGDNTIWDAGFWSPLILGDYVWYDKNGNGIQDAEETGISGVTVKLFKTSDNGATLTPATDTDGNHVADVTTDSNGKYLFTNLPAGDYVVEIMPPSGYTLTKGGADPDNDDNTDSNGYLSSSRILSKPVTLEPTKEPTTDGDTNPNSNLTIDFGLYKPMSLGNFVWADSNGNGIQDTGEPGIAGVSVQIFATADDGVTLTPATDITGNPVSATTTDANGLYGFTNLPPGDYVVQITPPADYFLTTGGNDPDNNDNTDSNGYLKDGNVLSLPVTLSSDDEPITDGDTNPNSNMTIDFGLYKPVSLGDFIWLDTNRDGIQDTGEPGMSGAAVQLFRTPDNGTTLIPANDINGNAVASITTGSDGLYKFTNLAPGNYVVQVTPPAGYAPTIGGADPDDDSNSDSNGYINGGAVQSHPVTLELGKEPVADGDTDADSNLSVDFGFIPAIEPAALGNYVWYDINKNGIQDADEPGIAGVTVRLLDASGNVLNTMTTDGSGYYLFDTLDPGTYSVEFVKPTGYVITAQKQGSNTALDSDADTTTGRTAQVTLIAGERNLTIDAGMYIPNTLPASLGDTVWYDANADGIQDSSEIGVAGVTVNLYNAAGVVISTTTTNGAGYYAFTGLAPGSYSVEFVKPSGYTFTAKSQGGDTAFDSDADTTTGKTATVTLTAGEHNPKIDAGLFMPSANPASLGDTVWYDVNRNGIQDAGETGVPSVTVNLLDNAGNIIKTTATDSSGYYRFANLTPGTYSVEFVKPAGYSLTLPSQGADNAKDSDANTTTGRTSPITLAAGEHNPKIDAGLYQPDIARLGDFVWYDTDNDGIQDTGEPGIAGVIVKLYNAAGQNIGVTQTDGTGYYEFINLAAGTYSVEFVKPNPDYTFSPKTQGTQNGLDSDADTTTGRTVQIALAGGENNPRIDAGMFIPGTLPSSLGDRVWYDTDKDGIQDAGESGISGVTVTLRTPTGQLIATTTTDGSGNYLFSGLAAGDYVVTFEPPSGYSLTLMSQGGDTAKDSDAGLTGSTGVITLGTGEHNPNIDAGMYSDSPPAGLGDYVWFDTNHNGIQDAGETGITGVTVRLLNAAGDVIAATTTDSSGYYHFTGLAPGAYSVEFVKPDGYAFSPKDQGSGALQDNFDSDADTNTGRTAQITLSAGENDLSIDAGLYISGGLPASLGDYVWYDDNKNGIQDSGEKGIAGVTVTLKNAAGDIIATTQTDGSGYYLFDGLAAGDYTVGFTPLSGYHFSPQTQGSDTAKDSDPDTATGLTAVVHLNSGEHNPTIDAGLYADVPPASLGDYVWYDTDKDGIQDSGETGVSGVTVTLYDKTGTVVIAATQTDVNGYYEFAGLIPGDYTVGFDLPGGYKFSPPSQGSDTAKDSNADVNTGRTAVVSLKSGEHNPTIDAGVYADRTIKLGDLVWLDTNNDGKPSSGEGIAGVTLNLYDGSGRLIDTTITDPNGHYEFSNLPPGDYRVVVDTTTLPTGITQFYDADGVLDSRTDALNQTKDNLDLDFGYLRGTSAAASLGDVVWYDSNADGIQDAGESGVPSVVVKLYNAVGDVIAATTTDNTGYYRFDTLAPGSYSVEFIKPNGYTFSPKTQGSDTSKDSNADTATGKTAMVTLAAGEHNPTIDAGLFMPSANSASLGDVVWYDTNHNGIQDAGEPGIAGVTVHLRNASGAVISTTVTDGTGYYQFTGLAPGSYAVEFVKPSGSYTFSPQSQGSNPAADSDANTSNGRTSLITLSAGEHNPKIDAGLYMPNMIPASLGNFVWYDSNHNGIQEQGELGIAGVTVHLLDASGKTLATEITDGSGFYQFTGLVPGQYSVEFVKPDTYLFSPKAMGYGDLKDAFDSDADSITGKTGIITLSGGENNPKIDAGLYIPSTDSSSISDKVWYDVNQDGIQDAGEPGIPGVTVRLYDENGKLIAIAKTDSTGFYIFSGLPKGEYVVEVEPPDGYSFSPKKSGSDNSRDSDVDPQTGRASVIILNAGEQNPRVDAGLYSRTPLAGLGNVVWYDADKDGIQDAAETGISGITVNLYDKTGTTIIAATVTDASGHYAFNGLMPGDYIVGFGLPNGYVFSHQSQGSDIGADSNADVSTGQTSVISLKAGENNPTIDAGVYVPNPIRLGDLVFLDKNNDGKASAGEGIPNVLLNLYDSSGTLIGTTRTDTDGQYEFSNLPPGSYRVTVDTTTLPSGINPFFDPDGVLNSTTDVKNQNTDNLTLDFGYNSGDITPPPSVIPCSIGDFVWLDRNHNGIQDSGEPGISGVRVNLYSPDGMFLATTMTDGNGYYIFDNLMPGTYIVGFDLPSGYSFTQPDRGGNDNLDSDADISTGRTPTITIGAGEHIPHIDAGLVGKDRITIGDLVWVDKNGDGVPSPGEGIPGVTVILLDSKGNIIKTAVTDDEGKYYFTDLVPGDYTVVVDTDTLPDGVVPFKDPDGVLDSETDLPNTTTDNLDADFGYKPKPTGKPDLTGTTKSVADINRGLAEPGDTLMYAVVIHNSGDKPALNVVYVDTPSSYTTLIPGSISTTQGTVSEIGGQVQVIIGEIPAKANVIIRYQVKINIGVSAGTIIANQGIVNAEDIPDTLTDFPDTEAIDDATVIVIGKPVQQVEIDASKSASVVGSGDLKPGGQISYQIAITNSGTSAAKDVSFTDSVPFHTTLVPGSVTTTQGSVSSGSQIAVSVGTLAPGQTVNIAFTLTVDPNTDAGTVIANQGVVKYDGDKTKPTDDPEQPGDDDITITPIPNPEPDTGKPDLTAYKTIRDVNEGMIEPGDILEYIIRIINPNRTAVGNVAFYDNPAGFSVFSPADAYYVRLIPNTVSNTHGQVVAGNASEDRSVSVEVGDLNPNEIAEIRFQVAVSEYAADGTMILNQGTVTVNDRFVTFTDDPNTLTKDDPTQAAVIHVDNGAGIRGVKTVSECTSPLERGKGCVRWELHWYNDNNSTASVHIEDPLAIGLTYIAGGADFGGLRYDEVNRKIVWDGAIPAGKELTIWFETTVAEGVHHLENQAYLWWDKNKNGNWQDDAGNPISSNISVWKDTSGGQCRLSLGNYLWIRNQLQCEDNGSVKPGWGSSRDSVIQDVGVNGVKINLYQDTDRNNKFTPGLDLFIAATITKNGPDGKPGYYRFDNLCDDDYIVQIDPANFLCPGGILAGYISIDGAADPDTDINSDNNGYSVSGFGVLSDAVTLKSGTEPVNDGDSDADTNLSVDFGFVQESPCKSCCSATSVSVKP